jgi:hypothetical protein
MTLDRVRVMDSHRKGSVEAWTMISEEQSTWKRLSNKLRRHGGW